MLCSGIMSKAGEARSLQFKLVEKSMPTTLGVAEIVYLKQQQQNYTSFSLPPDLLPWSTSQAKTWLRTDLLADGKLLLWLSSMGCIGLPGPQPCLNRAWDRGSWLSWMDIREEFRRNKQLNFKGNFGKPYISISHGFLLLSNIVTTNLNLLSSTIVIGFRLCQHIFKSTLWEFLGLYLMLTPRSKINQRYNIYYYYILA